jgi:hypothetical protein
MTLKNRLNSLEKRLPPEPKPPCERCAGQPRLAFVWPGETEPPPCSCGRSRILIVFEEQNPDDPLPFEEAEGL